ncbi:MAG: hypothetical protein HQL01_01645 [Nitrospirae bacterium]|nr:hypothetical protein [Nitrospirota bacterium]
MKTLVVVLTLGLLLGMSGQLLASGDGYDVKLYGTVEKVPDAGTGSWTIKGKEVIVTKNTVFDTKHGKAVVGSYVEVKGNFNGNAINAVEIEVKRAAK